MDEPFESPFELKLLAEDNFLRVANSIHELLRNKYPYEYELTLNFPLSQSINIKAPELIKYKLEGYWLTITIPLAILTNFPNGRLLIAIFDANSEDEIVSEILKKTGVKVFVTDNFSNLTPREINESLVEQRKIKPYLAEAVNPKQYAASRIIASRIDRLQHFNPFIILQEVMASSISTIKTNHVHSNKSSWLNIWEHVKRSPFDCVVVSKEDFYPLMALEFDGRHHLEESQIKKDALKNKYCDLLKLPLIRIDDTYLNKSTDEEINTYTNSGFLQNLVIELLLYSYNQRSENLMLRKNLKKYFKNYFLENPTSSNQEAFESYVDNENSFRNYLVEDEINSWEFNEFKKIYKSDPAFTFNLNSVGKINCSLYLPALRERKAMTLNCPIGVQAKIYGVNNSDEVIKKHMVRFLIDLAIEAGK